MNNPSPIQVIDYTTDFHPKEGDGDGHHTGRGKFVHLQGPDGEYLVLSPIGLTKYHAQVVARFCRDREDASFLMVPSGETGSFTMRGWRIFGGGLFHLDRESRTLRLYGRSQAYGAFDPERLPNLISGAAGWHDVTVVTGAPL